MKTIGIYGENVQHSRAHCTLQVQLHKCGAESDDSEMTALQVLQVPPVAHNAIAVSWLKSREILSKL